MTRTLTLRRAGLLAALALTLAACGGGSDADTAADEAESTTTTEVEATTTTEAETTTTEAETTTTEAAAVSTSDDLDAFCGLRAEADAIGDPANFFDPESVEEWFSENVDLMERAATVAPTEVADDMATMVAATGELQALFEEYGYDLLTIPEAELDAAGAEADAASDRVSDFVDANCPEGTVSEDDAEDAGVELDPAEMESLLATEEGRALVIDGFVSSTGLSVEQAECFLDALPAEELAALAAEDLAGAPSLFVALADCEIDISTLIPS